MSSFKDAMKALKYGEDSVSVAFEEVGEDWMEKVYKPDIAAKWGKLYKSPATSTRLGRKRSARSGITDDLWLQIKR